jgi:hypothetical protein
LGKPVALCHFVLFIQHFDNYCHDTAPLNF